MDLDNSVWIQCLKRSNILLEQMSKLRTKTINVRKFLVHNNHYEPCPVPDNKNEPENGYDGAPAAWLEQIENNLIYIAQLVENTDEELDRIKSGRFGLDNPTPLDWSAR